MSFQNALEHVKSCNVKFRIKILQNCFVVQLFFHRPTALIIDNKKAVLSQIHKDDPEMRAI